MTARPILTAGAMRAAEDELIATGISVDALMERAGAGVAEAAWRFAAAASTLIVCGPGNNGGDGYVAARHLKDKGVPVRVAATGEPRTDAARAARAAWDGPVEPIESARPAPLLIDCLFGTGLPVTVLTLAAGVWVGCQIQTGREINYLGTQFTLGLLVTLVQGPAPITDITPGLERFVGIAIGSAMLCMTTCLWPLVQDK